MNIKNQKFINTLLQDEIHISRKDIARLLQSDQDHYNVLLYLLQNRLMPLDKACKLWADSLNIAWLDMTSTLFQANAIERLPMSFAREKVVMPIYQMGDIVTVAMADPLDRELVSMVEREIKGKISPVFALRDDILDAIDVQYHSIDELEKLTAELKLPVFQVDEKISKEELEKIAGKQHLVDFTNSILLLAIKEDASDIHIEPFENQILIRFRIDGVLHEKMKLATNLLPSLLSRLKIMAGLDITERRRPQDGRISLPLITKTARYRISLVPTIYGEKAVLRILGQIQKKNIPQLEELNFSKQIYNCSKTLLSSPTGAFFITGPTGSGKTTTLFSALQYINSPEKNIMTIEDPVEYQLPGANQVQVNPTVDLTFAKVLRAFLRQDPDIILIGEIRDLETAKIATEAALTGHLVFATLHTNDAIQAVTRLVEIGVDPFLVGPSLIGVMSQRLVRKLCNDCKESYVLSRKTMDELFVWDGHVPLTFFRHKGCQRCKFTGYSGRIGIHEMVMVDDNLRRLVSDNAPVTTLRQAASEIGYKSIRYDGIKKVVRGLTSLEEIERVIPAF